jgi:hypothetical protein
MRWVTTVLVIGVIVINLGYELGVIPRSVFFMLVFYGRCYDLHHDTAAPPNSTRHGTGAARCGIPVYV